MVPLSYMPQPTATLRVVLLHLLPEALIFNFSHASPLGWRAPFINTALFTLAHLWQPYNYVTIFAMVLPLTLITWWRKSFYVQVVAHCLANTIGATASLVAHLQATP